MLVIKKGLFPAFQLMKSKYLCVLHKAFLSGKSRCSEFYIRLASKSGNIPNNTTIADNITTMTRSFL